MPNITKGYGQIGGPQAPKIASKNLKLGAITCRNRGILTIKCQTTARYSPNYEIGAEDLAWLVDRVKVLQELVEVSCRERLT